MVIVVIGAGGAGLSAAVQAKQEGVNKVVLLEKMPMVGGNTHRATGGLNAAETDQQKAKEIEDSIEQMIKDTMKGGYDKNNPELVEKLANEAKDAVKWLTDIGADLSDVGKMAGSTNYRTHRPTGGAAVGAHLVDTLKVAADKEKVDLRLWNEAKEIILDKDGNVEGVKATDKEGKEYTIKAKAVVIAAGGFSANQEMVVENKADLKGFATTNHNGATGDGIKLAEAVNADFVDMAEIQTHPTVVPDKAVADLKGFATTNHNGATGDGIKLAEAVNADFVDMAEIQTHPTVVPDKAVMVTEAVRGNGAILLNKSGKRFVNELLTRDVVSKAILEQDDKVAYLFFDEGLRKSLKATEEYFNMGLVTEADSVEELAGKLGIDKATMKASVSKAILEQDDKVAYLFFDEGLRKSLKATEEYFNMGLVTEADSVEELAEKLGIDKATMKASVDTYNKAVSSKVDSEFGREDLPRQLNQGKVYAIPVTPAVHHTMGGIKINTNAEVINKDGNVIKGLFAAGEVTGGVHGGNRLGGNALADIVVYGRVAGKNAAALVK